ncbi:Asp/Glu/hydantoin racemase [Candidatus Sumerlaeota bacterium]|nr:Asp/Glu/hydantoin racemase [Candidatus Sumerlaeota bacterium]
MAGKRFALLHTSATLAPIFKSLCDELIPGADFFHMVDESLIQNTIRAGRLTPATAQRVVRHLAAAEQAGAEVAMVTCSSIGPAVDGAQPFLGIPALRVDRPMADKAVTIGRRVGVLATLNTTLEPTASLIVRRAEAAGKEIDLQDRLCEGAFDAFLAGDMAKHDAMVREGLKDLGGRVDLIVLAQVSMARVADSLDESEKPVPILTSPRLGVEYLAQML